MAEIIQRQYVVIWNGQDYPVYGPGPIYAARATISKIRCAEGKKELGNGEMTVQGEGNTWDATIEEWEGLWINPTTEKLDRKMRC